MTSPMNPTEVFVDHALGLAWADIPLSARQAAATFLHDTLCVGAAGVKAAHADQILGAVQGWGQGGEGQVLGRSGVRLPAVQAAFINAFQMHAQEFDCVHEPAVLHPMATMGAAVMAECDRSGPYSGAEVTAALVVGADVALGLGVAAISALKFFRPATSGLFGAISAICRLRGVSREVALDAFGYGLGFASGTMQAHEEGKPALPVQIANAARAALMAVDLAEAGLPGPRRSLDGTFGYMMLFETEWDLAPVLASLGKVFRINEVSWKPFPTGRAAHGAIVATQTLINEHGLKPEDLEHLTYFAPPLIGRLVGRPMIETMTPAHARLCFPYLAGVVLTTGGVALHDFTPERLNDPLIRALGARVTVVDDGNLDPAAFVPARAVARLKDGRELVVPVTAQFGSPAWPLSREQHLAKAKACLTFAEMANAHAPLTQLFDHFATLDSTDRVFALACGTAT